MKKINSRGYLAVFTLVSALFIMLWASCKKAESNIEVVSNDKTKPGVVTNVNVVNLNGSAQITYTLPNSKNLLYVLAKYAINDKIVRETKASYYTDTVMVDGFAKSQEYTVTLYSVSRANIMSDPVTVKVKPLTPNYELINSNIAITPDFGGANFFGLNPNKAPIATHILSYNEKTRKYDEQEPNYISSDTINLSIRGFNTTPTKFGIYTTDRFGNHSDTSFKTITPLFETLLDKSKFYTYRLPTDSPIGYGGEVKYIFDGNTGEPGWQTFGAPTTQCTFGLGQTAKLSRLVLWERLSGIYGYQNIQNFTLWGSMSDNPQASVLPRGSAPGTVSGDWVNLGNFAFPPPPSGLPNNQANSSDLQFVAGGVGFNVPISSPTTKFIRLDVTRTFGGLNYGIALEMSFYGDPQ